MPDESPEPDAEPSPPARKAADAGSPSSPPAPVEDWSVRYKYLLADFENYRRRAERERETLTRQARAGMLRELLPIHEGFRTAADALGHLPAGDPVRKGLEILDREWMTFLKHEGVEPVAVVGRPFRSEEAEAVGEARASAEHPEGTIAEIVQQGYRFFGGLLRPAKVVVARAPAAERATVSSASPDAAGGS
jgi:molecular chaperone GrpE